MSDTHGPIEAEHRALMNTIARAVDDALNGPKLPGVKRRIAFVLLVAEFGKMEGGRVNYISNGNREDMIAMLREYLGLLEGRSHHGDKRQH